MAELIAPIPCDSAKDSESQAALRLLGRARLAGADSARWIAHGWDLSPSSRSIAQGVARDLLPDPDISAVVIERLFAKDMAAWTGVEIGLATRADLGPERTAKFLDAVLLPGGPLPPGAQGIARAELADEAFRLRDRISDQQREAVRRSVIEAEDAAACVQALELALAVDGPVGIARWLQDGHLTRVAELTSGQAAAWVKRRDGSHLAYLLLVLATRPAEQPMPTSFDPALLRQGMGGLQMLVDAVATGPGADLTEVYQAATGLPLGQVLPNMVATQDFWRVRLSAAMAARAGRPDRVPPVGMHQIWAALAALYPTWIEGHGPLVEALEADGPMTVAMLDLTGFSVPATSPQRDAVIAALAAMGERDEVRDAVVRILVASDADAEAAEISAVGSKRISGWDWGRGWPPGLAAIAMTQSDAPILDEVRASLNGAGLESATGYLWALDALSGGLEPDGCPLGSLAAALVAPGGDALLRSLLSGGDGIARALAGAERVEILSAWRQDTGQGLGPAWPEVLALLDVVHEGIAP